MKSIAARYDGRPALGLSKLKGFALSQLVDLLVQQLYFEFPLPGLTKAPAPARAAISYASISSTLAIGAFHHFGAGPLARLRKFCFALVRRTDVLGENPSRGHSREALVSWR
jgi:hypothetical protein